MCILSTYQTSPLFWTLSLFTWTVPCSAAQVKSKPEEKLKKERVVKEFSKWEEKYGKKDEKDLPFITYVKACVGSGYYDFSKSINVIVNNINDDLKKYTKQNLLFNQQVNKYLNKISKKKINISVNSDNIVRFARAFKRFAINTYPILGPELQLFEKYLPYGSLSFMLVDRVKKLQKESKNRKVLPKGKMASTLLYSFPSNLGKDHWNNWYPVGKGFSFLSKKEKGLTYYNTQTKQLKVHYAGNQHSGYAFSAGSLEGGKLYYLLIPPTEKLCIYEADTGSLVSEISSYRRTNIAYCKEIHDISMWGKLYMIHYHKHIARVYESNDSKKLKLELKMEIGYVEDTIELLSTIWNGNYLLGSESSLRVHDYPLGYYIIYQFCKQKNRDKTKYLVPLFKIETSWVVPEIVITASQAYLFIVRKEASNRSKVNKKNFCNLSSELIVTNLEELESRKIDQDEQPISIKIGNLVGKDSKKCCFLKGNYVGSLRFYRHQMVATFESGYLYFYSMNHIKNTQKQVEYINRIGKGVSNQNGPIFLQVSDSLLAVNFGKENGYRLYQLKTKKSIFKSKLSSSYIKDLGECIPSYYNNELRTLLTDDDKLKRPPLYQ